MLDSPLKLKGGVEAWDPRLDRVPEFDARSRSYPVTATLTPTQQTPRSYTWRLDRRWDQGQEGRCVEFAICHEMRSRPAVVDAARVDLVLANKLIYWPAQQEDEWDGGSYPGASPFYEGTSGLAGMKVATKLGFYQEYRWAFGVDDLILAVGHKGPACLGIPWFEDMFEPDADGFIKPTGSLAGYHEILTYRVNVREEFFELANSWGEGWGIADAYGVGGVCRVSFADMHTLLDHEGDAVIPMRRALGA